MARRDTIAGSVTVNPAARALLGNPTSLKDLNKGRISTKVVVNEENRTGRGIRVNPISGSAGTFLTGGNNA